MKARLVGAPKRYRYRGRIVGHTLQWMEGKVQFSDGSTEDFIWHPATGEIRRQPKVESLSGSRPRRTTHRADGPARGRSFSDEHSQALLEILQEYVTYWEKLDRDSVSAPP